MKIIGLFLLKLGEETPVYIASSVDLSFISWFKRPFFQETVFFGVRTCVSYAKRKGNNILNFMKVSHRRSEIGKRTDVHLDEAKAVCHLFIDKNNNAAVVVTDDEYPAKVAFYIITKMFEELYKEVDQMKIDSVAKDTNFGLKRLDEYLKLYQDPKEADKLLKLEEKLIEVTNIAHKTLEDLMKRGESLESLMAKSKDISSGSLSMYKKARQANQKCCSLY